MSLKIQKKILYIAPHALGDLVMSLPTVKLLMGLEYKITLLVRSKVQKEYLQYTFASNDLTILIINDYINYGKILGGFSLILRLLKDRYDGCIPQMNINIKQLSLLLFFLRVKNKNLTVKVLMKSILSSPRFGKKHKVNYNIDMAFEILGLRKNEGPFPLWEARSTKDKFAPKIILAPGSGEKEAFKRWPAKNYGILAKKIVEKIPNAQVKVCGAPHEAELCDTIANYSMGAAQVVGLGSIQKLHDSLRDADYCISSCNGASHVAARAGANLIIINGPSNLDFTGAYSNSRVVVTNSLTCAPCYRPGFTTGCGNPICISEITVDSVLNQLLKMINRE